MEDVKSLMAEMNQRYVTAMKEQQDLMMRSQQAYQASINAAVSQMQGMVNKSLEQVQQVVSQQAQAAPEPEPDPPKWGWITNKDGENWLTMNEVAAETVLKVYQLMQEVVDELQKANR